MTEEVLRTPAQVLLDLPLPEKETSLSGRSGYVSIAQLCALVEHHTMRRVSVSSENFGLVGLSKDKVLRVLYRMRDETAPRIMGKKPDEWLKPEARIHLNEKRHLKVPAFTLYIHTCGLFAWEDGERTTRYYRLWG